MFIINRDKEYSLSHTDLLYNLDYDPYTGIFRWKISVGPVVEGDIAGYAHPSGYWYIYLLNERYMAHRLAWFYCFEEWPENIIDHIDGNGLNNKLDNLREATILQNNFNRKPNKNNALGVKGVTRKGNKFQARIRRNGKLYSLGCYATIEEAEQAYIKAAKEYHKEFYKDTNNGA